VVSGQDIFVLDFEGEPLRPLAARRAKLSPLRDVAGMVRSFDYAANAFLVRQDAVTSGRDGETDLGRAVALWRVEATRRFLAGYRSAVADCPSLPGDPDAFSRLLDALVTEKALYEICYEAANRPDWLWIPLAGLDRLLAARP
jgi:maltose alpha-D-glucosyltransferase/alpha-amylase